MFEKKSNPAEKEAKLNVLKKIRSEMEDAMKSGLGKGKKEVTVSADSKEGLEKGLDMAKHFVEKKPQGLGEDMMDDHELSDMEEDEQNEMEDAQDESMPMDEHELDEEIQRLLQMKEKLQSK